MIKIKQTEDKELLAEILKQLKENDHYCPCSLTRTQDDKCMCKPFREIINEGNIGTYECACGRYIATITKD
jgi:hypothetical protein